MRTRILAVERLEAIAVNAVLGGYGNVLTFRDSGMVRRLVELDVSMDCSDPVHCELHARYSAQHGKAVRPLSIVVRSRCRKCETCRKRRAMFWQARAVDEWGRSPRTWFGTLTFRPDVDVHVDAEARLELHKKGVAFDELSPDEQFRTRVLVGGRRVTRFLKRLRENPSGRTRFRYLLVAEAHKGATSSGVKANRPHWHCLLHEVANEAPLVAPDEIAHRANGAVLTDRHGNPVVADSSFLKRQWHDGFSSFALCRSPQAAGYLCKYLTKEESSVRIRASFRYGNPGRGADKPAGIEAVAGPDTGRAETLDVPPREEGQNND